MRCWRSCELEDPALGRAYLAVSRNPETEGTLEKSEWIWMNGDLVPWEDAKVHVLSHGLHYGSGVFEGIRC